MIPYDKKKSQSDRLRVEFTAYLSKALDATMINFCREQRRQRAIYDALIQRDFSARESEDIYFCRRDAIMESGRERPFYKKGIWKWIDGNRWNS